MKRHWIVPVLALFVTACADQAPTAVLETDEPDALLGLDPTAPLDAHLQAALAEAAPDDLLEVVIDVDGPVDIGSVVNTLGDLGAGVVALENLSIVGAVATPSVISAARLVPGVAKIYLNRQLDYMMSEGLASIAADDVHGLGITGAGVGIAILDSGIDGANPDVAYPARTVQNVKFAGSLKDLVGPGTTLPLGTDALFVENLPNTESSMGHGTHVAVTAAGDGSGSDGKYTGVAPGADIVGLSVGDAIFMFWTLAGFDWILENQETYNIQVVNNSWGTEGAYVAGDPINEATRALHDAGVAVVFAAGNSGPAENTLNPYSAAPWVISVAAGCKTVAADPAAWAGPCADAARDDVLAGFSSRGIPGDPLIHPDITAPGALIVSGRASTGVIMTGLDAPDDLTTCAIDPTHLPFYTCASGTSMAAPHVAGVIALMEEASGGTLTPAQAYQALTTTARPMPGFAQWEVGAGYMDALAAVQSVTTGAN